MNLQKLAGVAAIALALIYVGAFIYFGVLWEYPSDGTNAEKIRYLSTNHSAVTLVYLSIYVLFGVVLSVLVVGLHERLKNTGNQALQLASLFGVIWVGLVIASGMITTIGLSVIIETGATDADRAFEIWTIVSLITESIGGGNELVGGLWVLLLSAVALREQVFSSWVNYLGLGIGAAGISTIYPAEALTMVFGLGQIFWFLGIGIALLRDKTVAQGTSIVDAAID